jgi:hypothetical protein
MVLFLLAILSGTFIYAQETKGAPGSATDESDLLKIERASVKAMLEGGTVAAIWFERNYDNDVAYTSPTEILTKGKLLAEYRSGERKARSVNHYDYHVTLYGKTAVVSYSAKDAIEHKGKVVTDEALCVDVFVR